MNGHDEAMPAEDDAPYLLLTPGPLTTSAEDIDRLLAAVEATVAELSVWFAPAT